MSRHWGNPAGEPRTRYSFSRGSTYEAVTRYVSAMEAADFPCATRHAACYSAYFPLGTFPDLYREDPDNRQPRFAYNVNTQLMNLSPRWRSKFFHPLRRAAWIALSRTKLSVSAYLLSL